MGEVQPILLAVGGLFTAVASVLAAWAVVVARRNEKQNATKEEVGQAFELQQKSMENVERDNERLRKRQDELHNQVESLVGRLGETTTRHRRCEESLDEMFERLRLAEARIAELGG